MSTSRGAVIVLLAAGGGTRFNGPTHKLVAELDGRPLWEHALANAAAAAGRRPIVVVTGAQTLAPRGDDQVSFIHHPDWARGQASSLAVALAWAGDRDADQVIVGLADQPFVRPEAWAAIIDAPASTPIIAARYDGRPGPHPVRLDRSVWTLIDSVGDRGAGPLMRSHPHLVTWIDCLGSTADIDTQEDLHRWTNC